MGEISYLFNVDVMIEANTPGEALEKLLRLLNEGKPRDYRIVKGLELGQAISEALANTPAPRSIDTVKKEPAKSVKSNGNAPAPGSAQAPAAKAATGNSTGEPLSILSRIGEFIANNSLIRLTVLKGKGIKLSLPCRILSYDAAAQTITIYHVDEKKVYQFRLSEIDDFEVKA